MGRLQLRLDAIKKSFSVQAPEEALAIMQRATQDLIDSGQVERSLGVGSVAPDFALPSTSGGTVSLNEKLARGPLVVTFFRGQW